MTASDTQGERTTSALDVESTAERAYRTSRTFRSVCSFVGGMTLGFLPLFLFLLNHLTIAPPLFPFNPSLTFCNQTHIARGEDRYARYGSVYPLPHRGLSWCPSHCSDREGFSLEKKHDSPLCIWTAARSGA